MAAVLFSSVKIQLIALVLFTAATFIIFGGTTEDERNSSASHRAFLNACEDSDFVRANSPNTIEAAKLCSCILSWHLNASDAGGTSGRKAPPPLALYQSDASAAGQGENTMDQRARQACQRPG